MGNVRQIEQGSEEVCWATAPALKVQELRSVLLARQARGEIRIIGQGGLRNGRAAVPYVRLAADTSRRVFWRKVWIFGGAGAVYSLAALALMWEARYLLMQIGGGVLLLAALCWLGSKVKRHCQGCPGV